MKLPEDPKERKQMLFLIVLAIGGLGFVAVRYGIMPLKAGKQQKIQEVKTLNERIAKAEKEIKMVSSDREAKAKALTSVKDTTSQYVLRSRYGNYSLSATEVIEAATQSADVRASAPREIGLSDVPRGTSSVRAPYIMRTYSARITAATGLAELIRLLAAIEDSNPLICITSLSITAQGDKPRAHSISFDVQWPVWIDESTPAKLDKQLSSDTGRKGRDQ